MLHRSGQTSESDMDHLSVTLEDGRERRDDDGDVHRYEFSKDETPEN